MMRDNASRSIVLSFTALLLASCSTTSHQLEITSTDTTDTIDAAAGTDRPQIVAEQTPATPDVTSGSGNGIAHLSLCPLTTVANAPATSNGLRIRDYQPVIEINGVHLVAAPVEKGCLSSSFGQRRGSLHKGIDLHNASAVKVYAAAGAQVREATYRPDYGNMIVLDHGNGVFTRYAHLESFADEIRPGGFVSAGMPIGIMGNTANYPIPRHLHYEVLTGEWGAQAGSFALRPENVFARMTAN